MDRFDVIKFEDLSGPQGGEWVKIGGGSFGVVFRGEYLGTEVAIKEVLPNNTYDVEKYFERECVLMKEARHPNIVQYIGLTKSPGLNGRIYIISEFVGGNLRSYIADKRKPFDWPLRVSFATDIARAVAYLHARNCLHRDLKGENLLITANDRIKVCDFGFARIAARNEEEMRRISYCGTDGYMSPEILMGVDFSLPSDVFSLGIIFCEIISRHLVDANTFKRQMPSFGLEEDEVREMASSGCPTDFIQLSLDCCKVEPQDRPGMREVIKRLRQIENEIMQKEFKKGTLSNIGSLRGSSLHAIMGGSKNGHRNGARPKPPRLPSFDGQVKMVRAEEVIKEESPERTSSEENSDDDMDEALKALEKVNLGLAGNEEKASKMALDSIKVASTFKVAGHGNPWWDDDSDDSSIATPQSWIKTRTAPDSPKTPDSDEMATSAFRNSKMGEATASMLTSKLSAMDTDDVEGSNLTIRRRAPLGDADKALNSHSHLEHFDHAHKAELSEAVTLQPSHVVMHTREDSGGEVTQSFMTARSSHHHPHPRTHDPSLAMATIASSIYEPALLFHRFTLVKSGMKKSTSIHQTIEDPSSSSSSSPSSNAWTGSLMPPQLILANALTKCNVCNKRLGFGAYMDCDDCPYKTHVGCAAMAEPNCQELQLPHSNGGSPAGVKVPLSASRRGSLATHAHTPLAAVAAATALSKVTSGIVSSSSAAHPSSASSSSSSSHNKKDKDAKSPPNTLSRGVNYFRKRNSKSPPPQKSTITPTPVRA